jgi:hypothetical protein
LRDPRRGLSRGENGEFATTQQGEIRGHHRIGENNISNNGGDASNLARRPSHVRDTSGDKEWLESFPRGDPFTTYVFTNANDVTGHNHDELKAMGTPILKVEAEHSCQAALVATGSEMMGLESRIYLSEGLRCA